MEASPEIIQYYNKKGLNGAEHFIYAGISVFPLGRTEEIKAKENEDLSKRLHGAKEGVLVGL